MWKKYHYLRKGKEKTNLNKLLTIFIYQFFKTLFMSKTVTISAIKSAKIIKLAKTMPRLTKVAALMKKAQDEGTLGPEEVKDIAEDTKDILLSVVEMVEDIAEGVPAVDGIEEEVVSNTPEETPEEVPEVVEGQGEEGEKREKENIQIAKLQSDLKQMKEASMHKDLTIKYGKLFPETVREAKEKEFAASKDSISILEARIKEAASVIKDRKTMKIAQLTDGSSFIEDDDNSHNSLDFKGKF